MEKSFIFPFYCNQCKTGYNVELTCEPRAISCPNGHSVGIWSYEGTKEQKCNVCEEKPLITILHIRKRHDMKTPKGNPIIVEGTGSESKTVFDHFTEKHREILLKSGLVKER